MSPLLLNSSYNYIQLLNQYKHNVSISELTTILVSDLISYIQTRPPKDSTQSHDVEVLKILEFPTLATLALWPLDMTGPPQLLRCNIVVVDKSNVEVSLVTAVIIWTALFEMITEPSPTVSLLVWIVARGTVRREASHGGLGTAAVHLTTGYVLDHVDVPPDNISRCPVMPSIVV